MGGASATTDGGSGQGSGKKKKISLCLPGGDTTRRPDINRQDRWELQKVLDEKERRPDKTYKCQTEANDKVWDRNQKTKRALETLAILQARFEQVNSDLAKVDKEFDREFEQMEDEMEKVKDAQRIMDISAQAVHDSRVPHRLASDFDERL